MLSSPLLSTQQRLCPALRLESVQGNSWLLPAEYAAEHARAEYDVMRLTGCVGMSDRSWVSILRLTGPDRHAFLQGMVTNDILSLAQGLSCHAALLDATGHIIASLRVHNTGDALLIETDPRAFSRLAQTLDLYLIMEDVKIEDVTGQWAVIAVRGEDIPRILDIVRGARIMGPYFLVPADQDAPGFDLWIPTCDAPAVWEMLFHAGVVPAGEIAVEILRVEAGMPAWGAELSEAVLLPEADLPDTISYTKGCYIGQEIIARLHARGHANRLLRGVLLAPDAPVPHPGDTVHAPDDSPEAGREIGRVTSSIASPRFGGRALALAYVRREYADNATPVAVHVTQPGGMVFPFSGRVLARPFLDPDTGS